MFPIQTKERNGNGVATAAPVVANRPAVAPPPVAKPITLDMRPSSENPKEVVLVAVDAYGDVAGNGILFYITEEMHLRRANHVNPTLGFDLDYQGRINLADSKGE